MPGDSSAIRAGKAFVEIYGDDSKLRQSLGKTTAFMRAWATGLQAAGAGLMALGLADVGGMIGFGKLFASTGTDALLLAERMGVTATAATQFAYAAKQLGSDGDSIANGIGKMGKFLTAAAEGSGEAVRTLAQLHLSVKALTGLDPVKRFGALADAINRVPDPSIRAGLALQVFGKNASDLFPLIAGGSAGMEKFAGESDRLGATIDNDTSISAWHLGEAFNALGTSIKMLGFAIGGDLAPYLQTTAILLTDAAVASRGFIQQHQGLVAALGGGGFGLIGAGAGLAGAGLYLKAISPFTKMLGTITGTIGSGIGVAADTIFSGLGAAIAACLSPTALLAAGVLALAGGLVYASGAGGIASKYLKAYWSSAMGYLSKETAGVGEFVMSVFDVLKGDAVMTFSGIRDALAASDWRTAARIMMTGLQLEFKRGEIALESIWLSFGLQLVGAWDGAVEKLEETWVGFETYLLMSWPKITYALRSVWATTIGAMRMVFSDLRADLETWWAEFSGMLTRQLEKTQNLTPQQLKEAQGITDSETNNTISQIQRDKNAALKSAADDMASALRDAQADLTKTPAQLLADSAARIKGIEDHFGKVAQDRQSAGTAEMLKLLQELADLQKELADSAKLASGEKAKKLANQPDVTPPGAGPDDLSSALAGAHDLARGTFQTGGLFGFGGGSTGRMDRLIKAAEGTERNTSGLGNRGTPLGPPAPTTFQY